MCWIVMCIDIFYRKLTTLGYDIFVKSHNPVYVTVCGLAIMVVDVVVGFILLVLSQDILAGHSRDDRQVSRGSLGNGRIAPVQ